MSLKLTLIELNRNNNYKKIFSKINKYSHKPSTLLDVGCGNGRFLEFMLKQNFKCYGTEVDLERYYLARKIADIYYGDITELKLNERFEVITLLHVIEHVEKPESILKEIYNLLEEDGIFIMVTADLDSESAKKFGNDWAFGTSLNKPYKSPHNHVSLKGEKEWCDILKGIGFEIIETIKTNKSPLHWLISYHFLKNYNDISMFVAVNHPHPKGGLNRQQPTPKDVGLPLNSGE